MNSGYLLPWGPPLGEVPLPATYVLELTEGHELDNVPERRLTPRGAQDPIIPVQDLHVREVSIAHPNDDDRHGQVGGPHNGLSGVRHVRYYTVREDEQDVVLLEAQGRSGCAGPQDLSKTCARMCVYTHTHTPNPAPVSTWKGPVSV